MSPEEQGLSPPGQGPCVDCFTPGCVRETTMNITPTRDFPSDGLFYCCLFRLFPKHLSISIMASSRKLKLCPASCPLHNTPPSLLHRIFQNKDRNRNLAEFCNTEVYPRPTFRESGGRGRAVSPWGGGGVHAEGSHTGWEANKIIGI